MKNKQTIMKTFKHYLLDMIKIITLITSLAWLVSCDSNTKRIRLIHQYQDSVYIASAKISTITQAADSIEITYQNKYPAKAFPLTPAGERARKEWRKKDHEAYTAMTTTRDSFVHKTSEEKLRLRVAVMIYQSKIDSLKLELQR